MAKRADHGNDSTQELSGSQLVVPNPPAPPAPSGKGAVNDRSSWGQLVVGADDFAPAPKAGARSRRGRILGALGAVVVVGAAVAYFATRGDAPASASSEAAPPAAASAAPATEKLAAPPAVAPPIDAAIVATVEDAAAPAIAPPVVDAISGTPAPIAVVAAPTVPTVKKTKVTKKMKKLPIKKRR